MGIVKTIKTGAKIYGASYLVGKGISAGMGKKTHPEEVEAEKRKEEHQPTSKLGIILGIIIILIILILILIFLFTNKADFFMKVLAKV